MEAQEFDRLTRFLGLAAARRRILAGLALSPFVGLASALRVNYAEAKKQTREKKQSKPNAFGCLEVGDACKYAEECCSGNCAGRQGEKRCRAHGAGTCNHGMPGFCGAADPAQALCNDSMSCVCLETTGGSTFCGSLAARVSGCADCRKDADCLALGLPSGSACVPFATGACAGTCESGMVCVAPCETAHAAVE
jgi:hypothetical protein